VDDEAHFRDAIARRLGKRGLTVSKAPDGGTALEILEKDPIDVVVTDVKMPGMDGIDLLGRIKFPYTHHKNWVTMSSIQLTVSGGSDGRTA